MRGRDRGGTLPAAFCSLVVLESSGGCGWVREGGGGRRVVLQHCKGERIRRRVSFFFLKKGN